MSLVINCGHRVAGCQRNKLFTPRDEKWVWHHNEAANAVLDHGCKSRFKIAFNAGGQYLQVLLKTVGCCSNLGLVFDIHIAGICEQCDCVGGREKLMQQFHVLWSQETHKRADTSKVTFGSTETIDQAHLDRIGAHCDTNGNRFGRCLPRRRRWGIEGGDHGHVAADQFAHQRGQTVVLTLSPAPFDAYVFTLDEAGVLQPLDECGQSAGERIEGPAAQKTDYSSRLLRACLRHPRCRATQKADELAPSHGRSLTPRTTPYHIVEKSGLVHHNKIGPPVSVQGLG